MKKKRHNFSRQCPSSYLVNMNFNKKSKYYQYFIDQIINKNDEVVLKKFKVNLQNIEIESEED